LSGNHVLRLRINKFLNYQTKAKNKKKYLKNKNLQKKQKNLKKNKKNNWLVADFILQGPVVYVATGLLGRWVGLED